MPTYEYLCAKCGEQFQVQQSFSDPALKKHKGCGGALSKVFGVPAISLKGSGFYKTDNPSSSRTASTKSEKSTESSSDASSTSSGTSEKKPAKKTEKKSSAAKPSTSKSSSGS